MTEGKRKETVSQWDIVIIIIDKWIARMKINLLVDNCPVTTIWTVIMNYRHNNNYSMITWNIYKPTMYKAISNPQPHQNNPPRPSTPSWPPSLLISISPYFRPLTTTSSPSTENTPICTSSTDSTPKRTTSHYASINSKWLKKKSFGWEI